MVLVNSATDSATSISANTPVSPGSVARSTPSVRYSSDSIDSHCEV